MQTDRLERIESRIETYTANLAQAVQGGSRAQFSMLLSIISANQAQQRPQPALEAVAGAGGGSGFSLPAAESPYPDPNEFYSEQLVQRFNEAVSQSLPGDFAYLNSVVDTGARTPRRARLQADQFEKVALISAGRLMLHEIEQSRQQIRTQA